MPEIIYHLKGSDARSACSKMFLSAGEYLTESKEGVTCLACKLTDAYLRLPPTETAGRPALTIPFHYSPTGGSGYWRTACGIKQADPLPAEGVLVGPDWEFVTCPDCLDAYGKTAGRPALTVRHGRPALTVRHFGKGAGWSTGCGLDRSIQVMPCTDMWSLVNCPDCLNIHSRESEIPMPDESPEEGITYGSDQERITAEHRHDWEMVDGPRHTHDCEECIYLGTKDFVGTYDLYWCSQGARPTVIARCGPDGDYESGLDFIDRTPLMALAYVRAVKAGLFHTSDLPGVQ